jgi:hypothetical protein
MADYSKKLRQMRDTVEQSDSGMTRSDETKARLKDLDNRIKQSESAGAGRGVVNPPVVKPTEERSPRVQEAIQEMEDAKARKKISDMGYAKGGSVAASKRADGIAERGKTRCKVC